MSIKLLVERNRSSPPEVFLGKVVLKIRSKFTSPDSSKKMFSADFILLENRGFTVAQNFLLSLMSFKSKFL